MAFQIGADIEGVESVLAGFKQLSIGLQKKYLGAAVGAAARSELASLKAATPRGPNGNLRRSVGVKIEKTIVKPWEMTSAGKGGKAVARIGYRRGKTQKGKQYGGNAAWWVEEGIKERTPNGRAFKIALNSTRKYAYLKPLAVQTLSGNAVFLSRIRAVRGKGMFRVWAAAALPAIERRLKSSLGGFLNKARDEAARRAARRSGSRR
jgi:hypothetical protein